MVAISLYKGNLHKVPDVPRRWSFPSPNITPKAFKVLLTRRAKALHRLRSPTIDSPNPNPNPECVGNETDPIASDIDVNNEGCNRVDSPSSEPELAPKGEFVEGEEEGEKDAPRGEEKVKDEELLDVEDSSGKLVSKSADLVKEENENKEGAPVNLVVEKSSTEDTSDVDKRIKEVKEKLEILNEKKHGLVQALKQILNAEEQLKRQSNVQGTSVRPPLPLQVDATTDSGSMTRLNTPRMGSDGNPSGDMEGGEPEDISNHNIHSRQLPRVSSTSPSSESQQRKPVTTMVPHSYRTTLAVSSSPSRFAPATQGQHSVSISGANYIASSPSPAASGGTSAFRDGRLPSPWN